MPATLCERWPGGPPDALVNRRDLALSSTGSVPSFSAVRTM